MGLAGLTLILAQLQGARAHVLFQLYHVGHLTHYSLEVSAVGIDGVGMLFDLYCLWGYT
jgi:hypothetical protein